MILQCSKKQSPTTTACFSLKVLESLSHHGLKYLDISECSNITSKRLATLLTQQPNMEQLSLQGTCQMSAIVEVFEASRRFLTRLRYVITSSQCQLQIITNLSNLYVMTAQRTDNTHTTSGLFQSFNVLCLSCCLHFCCVFSERNKN